MDGYFGDLYNNIVNVSGSVGACGHLIHSSGVRSFGVAACRVIVFGPVKKVLGDRMSIVPVCLPDPAYSLACLNESLASRLLASIYGLLRMYSGRLDQMPFAAVFILL